VLSFLIVRRVFDQPNRAHLAELLIALFEPCVDIHRGGLGERRLQRLFEQPRRFDRIGVGAADRFLDDLVDDPEREEIRRRQLERLCRLDLLSGVAP
jgi:hypothetical protein